MRAPSGRRRQWRRGSGPWPRQRRAPATADAAALIAAYDRFVSGNGFDIGLVNVNTGAALSVPAAVNTTDDELHPTLTPDGRYLVFMRTKLQPKLNGDIVPPATRTLHRLDRQTGTVTSLDASAGLGAGLRRRRVHPRVGHPARDTTPRQRTDVSRRASFSNGSLASTITDLGSPPTTPVGPGTRDPARRPWRR